MGSVEDSDDTSGGVRRRFRILVCSQIHVVALAFTFELVLLILAVLAALFGDLDPAAETILLLDFVLLVVVTVPTGAILLYCQRQ